MFRRRMTHSRDRWFLAGTLALACVLRCFIAAWQFDQLTIDRDAYLGIAENLRQGVGFCSPGSTTPTAFRPPLYPLLLALAECALPASLAVAAINIIAGVATVWLVDRLGATLELGSLRHVAALLIAVDPILLHATAQPMTEVVFTSLTTAWIWSVSSRHDVACPSWRRTALIGVFFGMAALCRPTIWPLAGLMASVWLFGVFNKLRRSQHRPSWHRLILYDVVPIAAGVLLVVSPWVIRNQLVFGVPIVMTTHGGYTLLLGNNPVFFEEVVAKPWGATWSEESLVRWQDDVERRLQHELGAEAAERRRDAWMSSEAWTYMLSEPAKSLRAAIYRIRSLWSVTPRGEGTARPFALRFGTALFYGLEYAAALIGLGVTLCRRRLSIWMPALLLIVAIQSVHLVYWTDVRMRAPLQPVLALLASQAIAAVATKTAQQCESL